MPAYDFQLPPDLERRAQHLIDEAAASTDVTVATLGAAVLIVLRAETRNICGFLVLILLFQAFLLVVLIRHLPEQPRSAAKQHESNQFENRRPDHPAAWSAQ